jgi:hypothetical protein
MQEHTIIQLAEASAMAAGAMMGLSRGFKVETLSLIDEDGAYRPTLEFDRYMSHKETLLISAAGVMQFYAVAGDVEDNGLLDAIGDEVSHSLHALRLQGRGAWRKEAAELACDFITDNPAIPRVAEALLSNGQLSHDDVVNLLNDDLLQELGMDTLRPGSTGKMARDGEDEMTTEEQDQIAILEAVLDRCDARGGRLPDPDSDDEQERADAAWLEEMREAKAAYERTQAE